MRAAPRFRLALTVTAIALAATVCIASAQAQASGPASWRFEPLYPPGLEDPATQPPVGLGRIGDLEFWAPNRGVLITSGNGSTIPAGLWAYDGARWHELSTVCGASDGRIAWAGPEDFWTISDGRPGQAANPANGEPAPLADRTLCHFSGSPAQVVGSYASPAFAAGSYQEMHAAGCLSESDCWFAGDPLPEPQVGAFQLHWDGHALSAEPYPQGHPVEDIERFGRYLYESVRIGRGDRLSEAEPSPPQVLRRIAPVGFQPTFTPLFTRLPRYAPEELPEALDSLRLGADGEGLWAAAGPAPGSPEGSVPAEVTVLHYEHDAWGQVLGPFADPEAGNPLAGYVVDSIAPEPGSQSAWVALDSPKDASAPSPLASATVARISADGSVSEMQTLPAPGEGVGPKGAASKIVCPAQGDCWMTTTQGWLFHLQDGSTPAPDAESPLTGLIGSRPADEGLPQVQPDAPPEDDSGLEAFQPPPFIPLPESAPSAPAARVRVALLSGVKTHLLHRDTLELRFHLAVKARVRLLAKRRRAVVARTRLSTLAAGERHLLLQLDPRRWPTKLELQTHALAPLPTVAPGKGGEAGGGGGVVVSAARFFGALGEPGWLQ
ncbi:MAG TPA: hypothetical protein VK781_01470 [Solirubrobacteraceae bacterium]|jgi:hypothetical protein|nr:hypothetical protein [Solirubrobacteraceae bacterium]